MSDNWYPWYPGDYARDTSDLTLTEDGAYRRLLDYVMMTGETLPDVDKCFRICRAFDEVERTAVATVVGRFFPAGRNRRADREMVIRKEQHERLSESGRRGGIRSGEARRGSEASSQSEARLKRGFKPGLSEASSQNEARLERGFKPKRSQAEASPPPPPQPQPQPQPPPPQQAARPRDPSPPPPPAAAAGSPPAPGTAAARATIPDGVVFAGLALTVTHDLHERLLRIAPARFLAEVYPVLDARLATGRPVGNPAGYVVGAISGRWGDAKRKGHADYYADPKPYTPPVAPEPREELTPEQLAEHSRAIAALIAGAFPASQQATASEDERRELLRRQAREISA